MSGPSLVFNWGLSDDRKSFLIIDVPTDEGSLQHIPLSERDISLMSYYDELGRQEADQPQNNME